MNKINIYQIYYDSGSKAMLEPGYLPLDNSANERPDWYELWPIRKFLIETKLEDNSWYGFLSPKFGLKTGISSQDLLNFVNQFGSEAEVILVPVWAWDAIAFNQNIFFQGDLDHPGLLEDTQKFLSNIKLNVNLNELVTHSGNSVFNNAIIAKPKFWMQWLHLIDQFYHYAEDPINTDAELLRRQTTYGLGHAPMKAFIQERLSAIVLHETAFRVASLDASSVGLISDLFVDDLWNRRLLQVCDLLKQEYTKTKDPKLLELFFDLRNLVTKGPRLRALEQRKKSLGR
jgi:hypothetical protein